MSEVRPDTGRNRRTGESDRRYPTITEDQSELAPLEPRRSPVSSGCPPRRASLATCGRAPDGLRCAQTVLIRRSRMRIRGGEAVWPQPTLATGLPVDAACRRGPAAVARAHCRRGRGAGWWGRAPRREHLRSLGDPERPARTVATRRSQPRVRTHHRLAGARHLPWCGCCCPAISPPSRLVAGRCCGCCTAGRHLRVDPFD